MPTYIMTNTLNVTVLWSPAAVLKNKITLLCRKGLSVDSLLFRYYYGVHRANAVGAERLLHHREALLRSFGPWLHVPRYLLILVTGGNKL